MASKVMISGAHGHFPQGKKREVVSLGYLGSTAADPVHRVQQLEQNIRFLQEQHQIMLSGLHREVEVLRRRNRDLQFQMVFSTKSGGISVLQTPTSSPEEDCIPRKVVVSPGQVNITPLQIELLERDLAELKTNFSESRTRNVYLQGVVEEQKKAIQALENAQGGLSAIGKKIEPERKPVEDDGSGDSVEKLHDKVEDAERLIRRFRRENEEQRKEIVSLRTALSKNMAEARRGGADSGFRNQRQNQHSQTSRFPPLHLHNQWSNTPKNNGEYQKNCERGANRVGREGEVQTAAGSTTALPLLRERNNASTSSGFSAPAYSNYQQNHRRGYPHHKGGTRTFRSNHRDQPEQD